MKALSLLVSAVIASTVAAEDDSLWKGKAELGIVSTSGNTETSSTNGKINLLYDPEKWRQEFKLEYFVAESEVVVDGNTQTQKTADRTFFLSKTDYKFTERSYLYALLDYADETFTDKDYIGNFSLGYGRTFIKEDDVDLHAEIGYGLRRFQERDSTVAVEEEVTRLGGKYSTKIGDNANFSQELTAELGEDFDQYKSMTALNVNINSSLALSVGYEVQHVTEVLAEGAEKTDTKTTVNLVYNFL
ncbi:DUF481 domain-containing protein [Pleionea sediminis]|uniref:DUF481 domain-containing protein n=1 Tax=Pleionea sediminis TaxID=2569479 RepID=UPI00118497EF|nr:DUF481 domain-containing protein [Pleionea sediminis]